jgi:outer membrane protein TolC
MALAHNRHLTLAHLSVDDAEQQERLAKAKYYPVIHNNSLVSYITELQGITIPAGSLANGGPAGSVPTAPIRLAQGANTTYASLTELAQPITQAFKIHEGVRAAHAELESAQIASRDAENGVALQVHQLYYAVLIEQTNNSALQHAVDAATIVEQETKRGVDEGRLLPDVELGTRTDLLSKKQAMLVSKLKLDDLVLQFDSVLGLPLGTRLILDETDPAAPQNLPNRDEAIAQILEASPTVLQARQTVEKAKAGVAAAKDAYIPNVTGLAHYDYQSGLPFLLHNFGTFGGAVSYDLFDGGAREASLKDARIKLSLAMTQLQQAEDDVRIQLAAAYDQIEELQALVEVSREAVAARQETLRIQKQRVQEQAALPSGVASSDAALAQAQMGFLSARLNLYLAHDNVARLLGRSSQ